MKKFLIITLVVMFPSFSFSETNVLSSDNGRYVFGQVSQARKDQYLLDTKTGKLWNVVANKEGEISLSPLKVLDVYFDDKSKTMKYIEVHKPLDN